MIVITHPFHGCDFVSIDTSYNVLLFLEKPVNTLIDILILEESFVMIALGLVNPELTLVHFFARKTQLIRPGLTTGICYVLHVVDLFGEVFF